MAVGRTARTALLFTAAAALAWTARPSSAEPAATSEPATQPAGVRITINTDQAPQLKEWAERKLMPTLVEWYPKISAELPVVGHPPPDHFDVTFTTKYKGVAYTQGTHIVANAKWITDNLKGESLGALVHEEVHVVQMPFNRRRTGRYMPGWMLEGTCDVIRWYQFEPVAVRRKPPHGDKVRYDAAYFPSATFLVWVRDKYDPTLLSEVNEASVLGKYTDDLFKEKSGKTLEQLGSEWEKSIGGTGDPHPPTTQPARPAAATKPAGK